MPPPESLRAHTRRYEERLAEGSRGWNRDGTPENPEPDHFADLKQFLDSPWLPAGGLALDVGCGGGQGSFLLARAWLDRGISDFSIRGIDFVPEATVLADSNRFDEGLNQANIAFMTGELPEALESFPDNSTDLILDNHFFHCLVDSSERASFLSGCARILKPDGIMFLANMLSTNIHLPKYDPRPSPRNVEGFQSFQIDHRYYADPNELFSDFRSAGLEPFFHYDTGGDIAIYAHRLQ